MRRRVALVCPERSSRSEELRRELNALAGRAAGLLNDKCLELVDSDTALAVTDKGQAVANAVVRQADPRLLASVGA